MLLLVQCYVIEELYVISIQCTLPRSRPHVQIFLNAHAECEDIPSLSWKAEWLLATELLITVGAITTGDVYNYAFTAVFPFSAGFIDGVCSSYTCTAVHLTVQRVYYPAAAHAQSGVSRLSINKKY